jgi:alpha-beta hydrolase superfamily lysophospholipase
MRSPQFRLAVLAGVAVALWLLFFSVRAYSERLNAILVPLWGLNFILTGRKLEKNSIAGIIGLLIGILGFNLLGSVQAAQLGARVAWWEPLQKTYFTAGLFVIYNVLCAAMSGAIMLAPKARELMVAQRGWWLRLLHAGLALCLFAPYLFVSFNIHRFKYSSNGDPQTRLGLTFEAVNFRARDGVSLKGWFVPSEGSHKTIVVVHGIGSNRGDLLGVAPFLHRAGFNLFLFDQRGHGDSSGHTITFGVDEARDVEAATEWASQRTGDRPVGVLAYSMGASSVLHAVGDDGIPKVSAMILDSTFAEFEPLARAQTNFLPNSLAGPMLRLLSFYSRLEIGVGLNDIAPSRYIGRVTPRPLLLIHGTGDTLIPSGQARLNFANAKEPKAIYWIDGAGHCAGHQVAGKAYEKRVVDFFKKSLK